MASEYLRKLAQEQPPQEKPRELTPSERRRNWLYYHKIWLIIGAVLLLSVVSILWNALGIGHTKPDYIFALVDDTALDDVTARAFEKQMALLGSDRNGDGKVSVELRQYTTTPSSDAETAWYYGVASNTHLVADITRGDSYFFLTRQPEALQRAYHLLADADGNPPPDGDTGIEGKVRAWSECPVLTSLDFDQTALNGIFLGRRCFHGDDGTGHEADAKLWEILTEGASR